MTHNPLHRIAKMRRQIAGILNATGPRDFEFAIGRKRFYWRHGNERFDFIWTVVSVSPDYTSEERLLRAALRHLQRAK
jgi:hypothetical protein